MPDAKRILLVDGDAIPRHSLAEQLTQQGSYIVIEAGSAAEARLAPESCVCAIIDAALPDGDGESLARELRKAGFGGFVLFLTAAAKTPPSAGEYLVKPFRLSMLLARLSARLGRHGAGDDRAIRIGPYLFRPGAKLIIDPGERRIRLTEKETSILKYLNATGRAVTRETLLHEVWGYSPAITTHTLETHIYRLRRKIEQYPGNPRILITEETGYRLDC
jgi:DNA-binding response OmpR family regulator